MRMTGQHINLKGLKATHKGIEMKRKLILTTLLSVVLTTTLMAEAPSDLKREYIKVSDKRTSCQTRKKLYPEENIDCSELEDKATTLAHKLYVQESK